MSIQSTMNSLLASAAAVSVAARTKAGVAQREEQRAESRTAAAERSERNVKVREQRVAIEQQAEQRRNMLQSAQAERIKEHTRGMKATRLASARAEKRRRAEQNAQSALQDRMEELGGMKDGMAERFQIVTEGGFNAYRRGEK